MRGVRLVTRKQSGLRPARATDVLSFERAEGVAVHHSAGKLGPRILHKHGPNCDATVRAIQDYHMAPGGLGTARGGADVAYSHLICPHGYTYRGRGAGVRTGANGSTYGNDRYYAVCVLGLDELTAAAARELDAVLDWYAAQFKRRRRTMRVRPHSDFTGTSCPGNKIRAFIRGRG